MRPETTSGSPWPPSRLQCRLVFAFVGTERMTEAGGGGQTRNADVVHAAILALVFGFLDALIQDVLAFVRPAGWRKQVEAVKPEILGALNPQYLH